MESLQQRVQRVLAEKIRLASAFPADRIAYTQGKTEFIERVTRQAKEYYAHGRRDAQ
jgi:GrpB-like predicted nucleotidyltransferase (UPF0157 family)